MRELIEILIVGNKYFRRKRVCDMFIRVFMRRENYCFVSLYFVIV